MECELCLNSWNFDSRIPKILPCGHTFCLKCLYGIIDNRKKEELFIFKCPCCKKEIGAIKCKKDIMNLPKNTQLLSLLDKVETQKSRTNVSNISMSMSIPVNTSYLDSGGQNLNCLSNDESYCGINNCFYPLCKLHKNKATFYAIIDGRMNYISN